MDIQNLGDTVEEYSCIIYIYDKEANGELTLKESEGLGIMMRIKTNGCIQSRENTKAFDFHVVLAQHPVRNKYQNLPTFLTKKSTQCQKGVVFLD